jgi:rhamnosyltransferase subunit B
MSRIVLTTLGSLGDLHPIMAIALALQEQGHSVFVATVIQYQAKIQALGLEFYAIRPDTMNPDDPEMMALMMDLENGTERILRDYIMGNLRDTYEDLIAVTRTADLLVAHEIIYAAPLVAEVLQIPWVTCVLSPGSFFSAYDPIVTPMYSFLAKLRGLGPGVNRWVVNFAKYITRKWGEPVHQLRQELGLKPIKNPIIGDKFSPYLVLALFSQVVGAPQPDWPPNVLVTGFTFYDGKQEQPMAPELQEFLDSGEPPIVFTLGSAAVLSPGDFYAESAAAAEILSRRAVLLIGNNPPPEHLPLGVVAFDYAPYSEIFPRAGAIVHQGGIGTTSQGLRSGKPTIVMPYSHDQPDNAARLQRLGISRTIPRQKYSTATVLLELIELLENPKYATKAAEIGRLVQPEDGVIVACKAIAKLLK